MNDAMSFCFMQTLILNLLHVIPNVHPCHSERSEESDPGKKTGRIDANYI